MKTKTEQRNQELLQKRDPKLFKLLEEERSSHITLAPSRRGTLNLLEKNNGKIRYFHSQFDPQKEAKRWFLSLNLKDEKLLYVYGLGLGYYYKPIKKWLDSEQGRYLVILEDQLSVIKGFLQIEAASELLSDSRLFLHYLESRESIDDLLEKLAWTFVGLQKKITALGHYLQNRSESFVKIRMKLMIETASLDTLLMELNSYGESSFLNYYQTIQRVSEEYHGNKLFGKFNRIPAVICGAGPSIQKQLTKLAEIDNKALIFSGGSSMNVLSNAGLLPHFGAGVDGDLFNARLLNEQKAFHLPFFYRYRFNFEAINNHLGPHLYVSGPAAYPVVEWIEKKMGISAPYLEDGYNVVHFCMELARAMGCNPIIFVGMDLAYTDEKLYSSGVVEDVEAVNGNWIDTNDPNVFEKEDIYGKKVKTHWKWQAESEWTGNYAKKYPDLKLINATEGGIGFPGIENSPLSEVISRYMKKNYPLREKVFCELQQTQFRELSQERGKELLNELLESAKRSLETINKRLTVIEKAEKEGRGSGRKSSFETLASQEIGKEPFFTKILEWLAIAEKQKFSRNLYQIEQSQASQRQKELDFLEAEKKMLLFYKAATEVNIKVAEEVLKKKCLF